MGAPDAVTFKYSPEDAMSQASDLVSSEIKTGLGSSNWKERVEALDQLISWVKEGEGKEVDPEIIARFFEKQLNGSEKIVQVS